MFNLSPDELNFVLSYFKKRNHKIDFFAPSFRRLYYLNFGKEGGDIMLCFMDCELKYPFDEEKAYNLFKQILMENRDNADYEYKRKSPTGQI